MAYPIFPYSPLPANLDRERDWGDSRIFYDSGASQGDSPYLKPLWRYSLPLKLFTEIKQSSLESFVDATKGMTRPFLMKDPYDNRVNSVLGVRSGITNAATLYLYDTRSYMIRPDSVFVSSMFSAASGFVRLGIQYDINQDTGVITVNTKAVTDVWGVRSLEFYRKCAFNAKYKEASQLWNIFGSTLTVWELP